jgi:actin-related protein 6
VTGFDRRNPKVNPIVQQYVLPDFSPGNTTGYIISGPNAIESEDVDINMDGNAESSMAATTKINVRAKAVASEEQILWMNNERFTVPEVLFNPSDIGESHCCEAIAIESQLRRIHLEQV